MATTGWRCELPGPEVASKLLGSSNCRLLPTGCQSLARHSSRSRKSPSSTPRSTRWLIPCPAHNIDQLRLAKSVTVPCGRSRTQARWGLFPLDRIPLTLTTIMLKRDGKKAEIGRGHGRDPRYQTSMSRLSIPNLNKQNSSSADETPRVYWRTCSRIVSVSTKWMPHVAPVVGNL